MSYAVFAEAGEIDQIDRLRLEYKSRYDAGDPTALGSYHAAIVDLLGEDRGRFMISGEGHLREVLDSLRGTWPINAQPPS